MTRDTIYTVLTKLLFGYQMDLNLFYSFLDIAQDQVESMRPWIILRAEDASLSVGAGNTFTTAFTIAPTNSNFRKWYGDSPIVLTDAQNNPLPFNEVPLAQKFTYKTAAQRFYCDYTNKQFYLTGSITQPYTIHQFYIKQSTKVSAASGNIWAFDTYGYSFSNLLAFLCAIQWKGVDYDMVALQNAGNLGKTAASILDSMTRWDSDLQASGQVGVDPFNGGAGLWSANSGGGTIGM